MILSASILMVLRSVMARNTVRLARDYSAGHALRENLVPHSCIWADHVLRYRCRPTQPQNEQRAEYMVRQNCPAGMLVTPETILFLTNQFTEFQPSSIEVTGTCGTPELPGQATGKLQTESELLKRVVL